jgi:hypothetical protein
MKIISPIGIAKMFGSDWSRPKDYERAVVVDAEFNETNKTTLRSERSCVPEKRKERTKIQKKFLTRAGIVRDAR